MVRKRFTEEQIITVLKEDEAGAKTADLCGKYGMSDTTYYKWKAKYAGLSISELKRLKTLEEECRRDLRRPSVGQYDPEGPRTGRNFTIGLSLQAQRGRQ